MIKSLKDINQLLKTKSIIFLPIIIGIVCLVIYITYLLKKTKGLYKRINLILANWNPLSIPKNIAEVEYLHYIPIIISLYNSKKKLESYLIKISLEMGLPRNKRLLKEISRIVNDIIKESLEQK